MKWISLTYLVTPLLIGCIPDDQNTEFSSSIFLKGPLEKNHGLTTTAEKTYHCYLVFKTSNEEYLKLAKTKVDNANILSLADDHLKISADFKRFYNNSKNENNVEKTIRTKKNINELTNECLTYGQTFGYVPWS